MNFILLALAATINFGHGELTIDNAGTFSTDAACQSAGAAIVSPVSVSGINVINRNAQECVGFTPAVPGDPSYTLIWCRLTPNLSHA